MRYSTSLKSSNLKASFLAALICLAASDLVAVSTIILNRGFGAGDLWAFLFWCLPFVGIIAGIAPLLMNLCCRLHVFIRIIVAALVGAVNGFIWTFVVASFLGAWFGAFSFSVLSCWIAGGASGMIAATFACPRVTKRQITIESVLIVAICLLAVVGTKPFFIWLSHDQRLYVLNLKLTPVLASELVIEKSTRENYDLTANDINQLESLGLRGYLEGYSGGYYGEGKPSRAIIVMQHQLNSPVELPQPDGVNVIYIQEGDEWRMYPANAPTLKRKIRLEIPDNNKGVTHYWVEHPNGARSGGQAFSWY